LSLITQIRDGGHSDSLRETEYKLLNTGLRKTALHYIQSKVFSSLDPHLLTFELESWHL